MTLRVVPHFFIKGITKALIYPYYLIKFKYAYNSQYFK